MKHTVESTISSISDTSLDFSSSLYADHGSRRDPPPSFDDGETYKDVVDLPCPLSIRESGVSLLLISMTLYIASTCIGHEVCLGITYPFAFKINCDIALPSPETG